MYLFITHVKNYSILSLYPCTYTLSKPEMALFSFLWNNYITYNAETVLLFLWVAYMLQYKIGFTFLEYTYDLRIYIKSSKKCYSFLPSVI